ncbi:MAG: arylesterase [Acidobacteriota bacterium]|nr:arylesterase [Acidobacteriota bacterium]
MRVIAIFGALFLGMASAAAPDTRPAVVAFGDSLSAGFGADPGKSFPDYLQRMLDQKGYHYRVVNAGVSGDTTTDGVERMREVLAVKPAVVILEFGGNDGLRGLPVAGTRANLEQMIVALQTSGAKVVLAGMTLPRNYGADYIRSFEKMYVDLAKQYKLVLIPFLLQGVAASGPGMMQQDSIHPTAAGNEKVAATVFRYAAPLLKK